MFDIMIIAIFSISILLGLWKGLIRQIVGFVGVVAGYMVAVHFYAPFTTRFLRGFSPAIGHIIAFLAIFVACIMVASLVGWLIGKVVNLTGLGILDRIGGALLGATKGGFIVATAVMVLIIFLPPDNGLFKGSRTMKYTLPVTGLLSSFAPKPMKAKYDQKVAKIGSTSDRRK
jgi:membrane protein required for colicin V production